MKKRLTLVAALLAGFASLSAQAQEAEGKWMVRVRALSLQPANESSTGTGATLGTSAHLPENAIHVDNKVIPELDISYFFTKNIAAELVLTVPQKQQVTLNSGTLTGTAAQQTGTFKHLPPSLLLQYHFTPDAQFRPYVGAGINYTRISSVNLNGLNSVTGGSSDLSHNSWGPAFQAGFDVKVGQNSFINFDVKKIYIRADLSINGSKVSTVKVDPLLWGVGYGFKF